MMWRYMRLILRIGGSVIASPPNPTLISKYANLLNDLKKQEHKVAVVVGGGAPAREFINIAKDLGLNEKVQDEAAISVSKILAQLLLRKLGKQGCASVPSTIQEAASCLHDGKIPVMGGLKPGMTTDTVAALIGRKMNAELFIKATNQEGIYNKDPKKHADATKLEHLSFEDLSNVLTENRHKAGIHQILDPQAIKLLKKGRIRVVVVNGDEPKNVSAAVDGKKIGTLIE